MKTVQPRFLRSDYVLSKREEEHMKETLEEEKHEDERLEKDIIYFRETLEKLRMRQKELRTNIQQRRSVLSPLRRVPTEIWEIIFSVVCSSTGDGYSLHIDNTDYSKAFEMPPLILSQVCSRWRQITVGYPKMWASISIHFADLSESTKHILELFLDNSQGCDLNVRAQTLEETEYPLSKTEEDAWELLTQHLGRCTKITFDAENFILLELPSSSTQQITFPNLMIYEEDAPHQDPQHKTVDSGRITWWNALRNAPKLTQVSTHFLHPSESIPYSQLTTLKLRYLHPEEVLELFQILPNSPQLEVLVLALTYFTTSEAPLSANLHPVEIPSLHSLAIRSCDDLDVHHNFLKQIFGSLRMPALRSLHLWCRGRAMMVNGWPTAFLSMVERSDSLRDVLLYIDLCETPASVTTSRPSLVSPLLRVMPNVEILQLAIESSELEDTAGFCKHADPLLSDFLRKLTQVETPLLPKLVNFTLWITDITLDARCAEAILSTAVARSPSVQAVPDVGGAIRPISQISVFRFRDSDARSSHDPARYKPIELGADLSARVQGLRKDGVMVDIGVFGGIPTQLVSRVMME
ncbi:hypothetical protein V5O48_008930 [Marasmius crinis-equi]|uniref:F-box domain-containing protein n=1 Tax=Marasmius crinis-equi TaxID=585013 RepID=A0ABR3FCM5_9AGAR